MSIMYDFGERSKKLLEEHNKFILNSGYNWEPQGKRPPREERRKYGGSNGIKNTVENPRVTRTRIGKKVFNKDGVEYYYPLSQFENKYNHLKTLQDYKGGSVKSVAKEGAKFALSTGLDLIPTGTEYIGQTLGTVIPGALGQPELAPITGFVGKQTGKYVGQEARKLIKKKTGYGKNGGAYINIAESLLQLIERNGVDLSGTVSQLVKQMGAPVREYLKSLGRDFLDKSMPGIIQSMHSITGNINLTSALSQIVRGLLKSKFGLGKAPPKKPLAKSKYIKQYGGCEGGAVSSCGGSSARSNWVERCKEYQKQHGVSYKQAMIALKKK